MKHTFIFSSFVVCLGIMIASCGNKPETSSTGDPVQTMSADTAGNPAAAAAHTETGVPGQAHYKCGTAGCTGTGSAAGKCPVCGSELVHNAAFHGQAAAPADGSSPEKAVTIDPTSGKPAITPVAGSATPPPAKNEKGVYHFACSKAGCTGGGAAAGKCPKCGGDLAHNPDYHNK